MVVADDQVAALRAYLAGDADEWERLHQQLIESSGPNQYSEFVYAAFVTAVRRRFSPTWTRPDVIRFVAAVRAQLSEDAHVLDPKTAENLIRRALDDVVIDNAEQEAKARAQLLLLAALIEDEQLDGAELDQFLGTVRTLTGQW
jgi:hypothetical protein